MIINAKMYPGFLRYCNLAKIKTTFALYQPGYRSAFGGKESPDSKEQHTGE